MDAKTNITGFTENGEKLLLRKNIVRKISSGLSNVNLLLTKLVSNSNSCMDFNKLSVCVSQIRKMLDLLMKTNEIPPGTEKAIASYVSVCIDRCFNKIDDILTFNDSVLNGPKNECLGCFITKMDKVLHRMVLLSQLKKESDALLEFENNWDWKDLVDDLIAQAITTAKISGGVDSNEITSTCHKVLKECKQLNSDDSLDFSLWKLHCEILGDALMQLERRVSSALLRLLLKVFSDVQLPLKRLIGSINTATTSTKQNKKIKDLDKVVEEFDYHNECIQHLCLFALAFSDDETKVLPINSCLASLESLDDTLVPAVLDLYMDQANTDKLYFLKFLVDFWMSEVNNLESLLDSIIDPTAFTTITLQSIQSNLERVKSIADYLVESTDDDIYKTESSSYYGLLDNILTEAQRLVRHLKQCNNKEIAESKSKLKLVINECKHIIKLPMKSDDYKTVINRTLKRFNLLVAVVSRISKCLSSSVDCIIKPNSNSVTNNGTFQDTTSLLNRIDITFPNSIKDIPLDITEFHEGNQSRKIGRGDFFQNVYFANLHKKKRTDEKLLKVDSDDEVEHYISNLTSKYTFANTLYEPSPRKKQIGNRNVTSPYQLESLGKCEQDSLNSSCGLEITDILENLEKSNFKCDTVSTIDNDIQSESITTLSTAGTSTVFSLLPSSDFKQTSHFNRTEQMIDDLRLIEDKLKLLRHE